MSGFVPRVHIGDEGLDMTEPELRRLAEALGYHPAMGALLAVATGMVWLLLLAVALGLCIPDFSSPP